MHFISIMDNENTEKGKYGEGKKIHKLLPRKY